MSNQNNGSILRAVWGAVGAWKRFDVVDAGAGLVALRAVTNGQYVMDNQNNGSVLQATASTIGS